MKSHIGCLRIAVFAMLIMVGARSGHAKATAVINCSLTTMGDAAMYCAGGTVAFSDPIDMRFDRFWFDLKGWVEGTDYAGPVDGGDWVGPTVWDHTDVTIDFAYDLSPGGGCDTPWVMGGGGEWVDAPYGKVVTGPRLCFSASSCYLDVTVDSGGYLSSADSSGLYWCDQYVTLAAFPNTGWHFLNWTGDVNSDSPVITVFMNGRSRAVAAHFERDPPPPPPPPGGGGITTCDPGHGECLNGTSTEPLVLDLNGDGVHTTAVDVNPIRFDANGDGVAERMGWTDPNTEEALLFYDHNHNGVVDGGAELFGDLTVGPDGQRAATGAEALAKYDLVQFGGNGNGAIDAGDRIWGVLRLWVDRDHDGVADVRECYPLAAANVVQINLDFRRLGADELYGIDASNNWHLIQGTFVQRITGRGGVTFDNRAIHDVYFLTVP